MESPANTSLGNLAKLPLELRLEIFEHAIYPHPKLVLLNVTVERGFRLQVLPKQPPVAGGSERRTRKSFHPFAH